MCLEPAVCACVTVCLEMREDIRNMYTFPQYSSSSTMKTTARLRHSPNKDCPSAGCTNMGPSQRRRNKNTHDDTTANSTGISKPSNLPERRLESATPTRHSSSFSTSASKLRGVRADTGPVHANAHAILRVVHWYRTNRPTRPTHPTFYFCVYFVKARSLEPRFVAHSSK